MLLLWFIENLEGVVLLVLMASSTYMFTTPTIEGEWPQNRLLQEIKDIDYCLQFPIIGNSIKSRIFREFLANQVPKYMSGKFILKFF